MGLEGAKGRLSSAPMKSQFLRSVRLALMAGLACAWALLPTAPAYAAKKKASSEETHDYNERLVTEFTPLVGNREETEALVSSLRNGRAASGNDDAVPNGASAPLSYGETRYALKLAQGRLAQEGVTQPSTAQLQAALYGGTLDLPAGTKVLAGVMPQHDRGVSWGALAREAGMTAEDLIPPASARAKKTARPTSSIGKKAGKKASNKTTRKASTKATKKTGKSTAKHSKAVSKKPTAKP
jgi:hypothetical protein